MKDRDTNKVMAEVVSATDRETLQGFVVENTTPDTTVYTDEAMAYRGIPRDHLRVKHGVGEYVPSTTTAFMVVEVRKGKQIAQDGDDSDFGELVAVWPDAILTKRDAQRASEAARVERFRANV